MTVSLERMVFRCVKLFHLHASLCRVNEVFALLGSHEMLIGSQAPTFQDCLPVPSSRDKLSNKKNGKLILENGTDMLFRKVGN